MAELVNITTAVVKRYGGTVDKFTGDGIAVAVAMLAVVLGILVALIHVAAGLIGHGLAAIGFI